MSASPTNQTELVVIDKRHSMTVPDPEQSGDILSSLNAAARRGDLAMVEKLMDLRDRNDATEARKAFVQAMSDFKAEAGVVTIVKDKVNPQYNSNYVSLGKLVATITPYLSKHGLSADWDIDQTSGIKVTCNVTHCMGGSKSVAMTCPPDKSGAKNPIHEIKSAITYAKACTYESALGLAATDANVDNDGNGGQGMDENAFTDYISAIKDSSTRAELQKVYGEAYQKATAAKDKKAQQSFIAAKNARYRELSK
jgi:hypothetical protein